MGLSYAMRGGATGDGCGSGDQLGIGGSEDGARTEASR